MAALPGTHLILYDGVCGLCHRLVRFVLPRDVTGLFAFASLQSAAGQRWLARFGVDRVKLETFHVVTRYQSASPGLLSKSAAALFVADQLGAPWRWLAGLRVIPEAVLDRLYDVGATYRYRVFGRYDSCPVPGAETRARFLDAGDTSHSPS